MGVSQKPKRREAVRQLDISHIKTHARPKARLFVLSKPESGSNGNQLFNPKFLPVGKIISIVGRKVVIECGGDLKFGKSRLVTQTEIVALGKVGFLLVVDKGCPHVLNGKSRADIL